MGMFKFKAALLVWLRVSPTKGGAALGFLRPSVRLKLPVSVGKCPARAALVSNFAISYCTRLT